MSDSLPEFKALGKTTRGGRRELEVFPAPSKISTVRLRGNELTSTCPVTHQPDFYDFEIAMEPDQFCLESKSLKLYIESFRTESMFAEALSQLIAEDIMAAAQPHWVKVTLVQNIRGGIIITAVTGLNRDEPTVEQ